MNNNNTVVARRLALVDERKDDAYANAQGVQWQEVHWQKVPWHWSGRSVIIHAVPRPLSSLFRPQAIALKGVELCLLHVAKVKQEAGHSKAFIEALKKSCDAFPITSTEDVRCDIIFQFIQAVNTADSLVQMLERICFVLYYAVPRCPIAKEMVWNMMKDEWQMLRALQASVEQLPLVSVQDLRLNFIANFIVSGIGRERASGRACQRSVVILTYLFANHAFIHAFFARSQNRYIQLAFGILRYWQGDYEKAVEIFTQLRASFKYDKPSAALALSYRSLAYGNMGLYSEALRYSKKALKKCETLNAAWVSHASALVETGFYPAAQNAFERAGPTDLYEQYESFGALALLEKRYDLAIASFEEALKKCDLQAKQNHNTDTCEQINQHKASLDFLLCALYKLVGNKEKVTEQEGKLENNFSLEALLRASHILLKYGYETEKLAACALSSLPFGYQYQFRLPVVKQVAQAVAGLLNFSSVDKVVDFLLPYQLDDWQPEVEGEQFPQLKEHVLEILKKYPKTGCRVAVVQRKDLSRTLITKIADLRKALDDSFDEVRFYDSCWDAQFKVVRSLKDGASLLQIMGAVGEFQAYSNPPSYDPQFADVQSARLTLIPKIKDEEVQKVLIYMWIAAEIEKQGSVQKALQEFLVGRKAVFGTMRDEKRIRSLVEAAAAQFKEFAVQRRESCPQLELFIQGIIAIYQAGDQELEKVTKAVAALRIDQG